MAEIQIGNRIIGHDHQPFVIAEAGINHNGKLPLAFEMIRLAKQSGADAVKFQTFKAAEFVSDPDLMFTYQSQGQEVCESMLEMFQRHEFSAEQWVEIKRFCEAEGIIFLSTPQNYSDLELLLSLGIPAIKVGSDDFNNIPLLKRYAQTGLPLILSCGMADLADVYKSLQAIGALDGYPVVLLLCTSQYPTPPQNVNIYKLKTLRLAFPMLQVGFSDHTQGPLASALALAMGAVVFEKHFTLDHDLPGPDHWFSEDPQGLHEWISTIRSAHQMMGSSIIRPTPEEEDMRKIARRSIVTSCAIPAGEVLNMDNLELKRPGTGIAPDMLETILGHRALKPIPKGHILQWGDFDNEQR